MEKSYDVIRDKQIGKVESYDGEAGFIVTQDNEYLFFKKDIQNNEKLNSGDIVSFYVNHIPFGVEVMEVAKFVEKEPKLVKKK